MLLEIEVFMDDCSYSQLKLSESSHLSPFRARSESFNVFQLNSLVTHSENHRKAEELDLNQYEELLLVLRQKVTSCPPAQSTVSIPNYSAELARQLRQLASIQSLFIL